MLTALSLSPMLTSKFDYILWLMAPAFQMAVLVLMERRKLRQQFPFFFTYTTLQVVNFPILFTVYHRANDAYFDVYWISTVLSVVMGFAVIHEVFSFVIRPYPALRDLGAMLFRWAVLLLFLVAGISAAAGATRASDLTYHIVNLERTVRLIQCGLLLFVVMTSNYLGLSWRSFAFGISFGFGIFAATDLVLYNLRASHGADWNAVLSLISTAVYNLSVLVWFSYSLLPQTAMIRNEVVYRPAFDRWNQAAMLLMNNHPNFVSSHTYLSDIEQTVEAVLAQQGKSK